MAALTLLAALLGATALAYNMLANARVTAVGVLVSFVVLVQFASFLGDLEERSRRGEPGPPPSLWRALFSNPRRLVEVLVDFAIICASFLAAYLLFVDGGGTNTQRAIFLATLPVLLARPLRPLRPRSGSTGGSGASRRRATCCASRSRVALSVPVDDRDRRRDPVAVGLPARGLPRRRAALHDARRRLAPGASAAAGPRVAGAAAARARARADRRRRPRRAGRSHASSPRRPTSASSASSTTTRAVRAPSRARAQGPGRPRRGGRRTCSASRPDEVLVTIPDVAPRAPARASSTRATAAGIACRIVRRTTEPTPPAAGRGPAE